MAHKARHAADDAEKACAGSHLTEEGADSEQAAPERDAKDEDRLSPTCNIFSRKRWGRHSVYRIFPLLALSVIPAVIIAPMSPVIIKARFHVSMCPNISSALYHNATSGEGMNVEDGYAREAIQDSGRGVAAVVSALVAGCIADKFGR